jgi:hypothetical protein
VIKLHTNPCRLNAVATPGQHDVRVAHALMQAIGENLGPGCSRVVLTRAAEILRETFGIEETGHD